MIYYHCKFLLDSGEIRGAVIPADTYTTLLEKIDNFDGTLLKITKVPNSTFKMSTGDSIFFFTYLREFLNADIPLVEALDTIIEETRKVNIKAIASRLQTDISSGNLLSQAMANQDRAFSDISISFIAAAEKINTLSDACNHIVQYLEFNATIRRQTRSAVTYPVVMFAMIFAMILFYSTYVIPKLGMVFADLGDGKSVMPIQTRALVAFAYFISHYWALIISSIIGLVTIVKTLNKISHDFRVLFDKFLLFVPFVSGIIIKTQFARFALFTANMYEKGYNFLDSFAEATVVITNYKIKEDLENTIEAVKSGENVYRALRNVKYIPRFVHRMFRVAESTSNVQRPLDSVYVFYASDIQNDLEKIIKTIKPLSMIILGGLMFWIITATLLPFYTKLPSLIQGYDASSQQKT
jgi:type II secretory pathway component PulF